ncbi:MAG: hypothetical protein ACYC97_12405 [Metallibacterium sp.]
MTKEINLKHLSEDVYLLGTKGSFYFINKDNIVYRMGRPRKKHQFCDRIIMEILSNPKTELQDRFGISNYEKYIYPKLQKIGYFEEAKS